MYMDKIKAAVMSKAVDGRITCKEAIDIANSLNVSPGAVGKVLNEMKIKIKSCQLGCF
jgi:hypothetical protein